MRSDTTTVRTASGVRELARSRFLSSAIVPPSCANPDLLRPLLAVAAQLVVAVPESSAAAMRSATQRWLSAIQFWGVPAEVVDERIVLAYIVARCAPPIATPLPDACARPVLPTTVATEIGALRRAAALGVDDMRQYGAALSHPQVSNVLRHIGGRVRRLKTAKRALLLREVRSHWEKAKATGTWDSLRDGFALIIAFFYACRARELLHLSTADLDLVELSDGRSAVQVTFRQTKTRQSTFATHEPFVVTCAHTLVVEGLKAFDDVVEFMPRAPIFRVAHQDPKPMSREWLAAVVRRAAPDATPHSCRVGCATELWAAGASIDEIMAVGRWTSVAATLYVLGSMQDQVRATDKLGDGSLLYTTAGLQKSCAMFGQRDLLPTASTAAWARVRAVQPADSSDDLPAD